MQHCQVSLSLISCVHAHAAILHADWSPGTAGKKDTFVHASRRAPRCLPCNVNDSLAKTGVGEEINLFHAVRACPCTLDAMCKGAANHMIIHGWKCEFTKWRPGLWHFSHGGERAHLYPRQYSCRYEQHCVMLHMPGTLPASLCWRLSPWSC